jgi:hypothetical protein
VSSNAKPRPQRLILAGVVALAILLLLLRLLVFAHGHERHRFRGALTRGKFHDHRTASINAEFHWRREYISLLKALNPGTFSISPAHAGFVVQPKVEDPSDPAILEVQP